VTPERALPWWASDGPVDGGIDRRVDPIERHRAARRGDGDPTRVDDPPWWAGEAHPSPARPDVPRVAPPEAPGRVHGGAARQAAEEPARHRVDACGVCPFCTSLRLLQDARPELVEHLTEAARHLAAAARSLLDTPVPADDAPRSGPSRSDGRLQRIVLDDDPGGPGTPGAPGAPHDHPGGS
jgi:hypothetical protein